MSKELAKTYDPKQIEEKLYERWCEIGRASCRERVSSPV